MALFSAAFRPFFLFTALIAIIVPMYFVCVLINDYSYAGELLDIFSWHGHEMIFGFSSALLTGFLLTASANWTGKKVISQYELIILSLLWLIARGVLFYQPNTLSLLILAPLPFVVLLFKMLITLRGNRNCLPIVSILALLSFSQISHLYGALMQESAWVSFSYKFAGLSLFTLLFIFSGRLIPFFTNNKLGAPVLSLNNRVEIITYLSCLFSFIFYLSDFSMGEKIFSFLSFLLMIHRSLKLVNIKMFKEIMLSILVMAHSLLTLFFGMRLFNLFFESLEVGKSSYHILFAGALACFALAIMTRASLGHSGRKIEGSLLIRLSFYSLILGIVLRVFVPLFWGDVFTRFLHVSMGFWTLSFIFFVIKFLPIFIKKRPA